MVSTFGNNSNIISNIIPRTLSIATCCKYARTLVSEICALYRISRGILRIFGVIYMKHGLAFGKRSLVFMICIYLPSFIRDVLFQYFDVVFKSFCCIFELNNYFRLSNFLFNYLPTIKRYIIGVFFRRTVGIFTATISLAATISVRWTL